MEILLIIIIGLLYASGIYMMLRRSLVKLIIGLILISHGVNMLIFLVGGIVKGKLRSSGTPCRCYQTFMLIPFPRH